MISFMTQIRLTGFELSSDEDDLPQENDDPPDIDPNPQTVPPSVQPPTQRQPPHTFDFADFMRRSGGNTASMLSVMKEADNRLPPGPIIVYSERAGGAMRLHILHI